MEADGSNRFACEAKMNWLEPKWYGSVDDLLAFGRACRETKNWRAGITLLGAHAHLRASKYLLADERTKYFRSAQVWDEIRGIYTEYLEHCPDDYLARSEYAGFSYMAGRWGIAHKQFQKLGANISWSNQFPEDWIKKARDQVAAKIRSAQSNKPLDGR
jgi:hypothetical protein